eukprot:CAMPEP_0119263216 /NCGR_PEP_ID=MMETSP1329-20130426/2687_1 /TAXON_ID=114041 /ORGANISM="Genus nov. species nov., Strain RCC1024" /LENGTH=408 /DNA_ID=CAMNT_0007262915 /DNA_START=161 /DNA_END=1384 /DNA_ORIENTATION=-
MALDGSVRVQPQPQIELISVQVPDGVPPGAMLEVVAPSGAVVRAAVPANVPPGGTFQVSTGPPVAHASPAAAPVKEKECGCCLQETVIFLSVYVGVLIVCAILAVITKTFGLVLLALAPMPVIFCFAYRWHKQAVTRCSMFEVMGMATLILIVPLMIAISLLDTYLPMREECGKHRSRPFWRYFFMAYVRAGLLEELLKYFALRRLLFKDYVVDPRSFLVYGALAGATFGVIENIFYTLGGGIATGIIRSLLTVPLHTCTGLQIASNIFEFRFDEAKRLKAEAITGCGPLTLFHLKTMVVATWCPVLLHGTYDVLLLIRGGECQNWLATLIVIAYVGALTYFWYITNVVVAGVERKYPRRYDLDVHKMLEDGGSRGPAAAASAARAVTEQASKQRPLATAARSSAASR